jgi:hypothetical protein
MHPCAWVGRGVNALDRLPEQLEVTRWVAQKVGSKQSVPETDLSTDCT